MRVILDERYKWFKKLKEISSNESINRYSKKLFEITNNSFPQYIEELKGISEGAGLDFTDIWLMNINSEISSINSEPPGCSTIYYKDNYHNYLFHNEDGDKAYYDKMLMVKVEPPSGIKFYSMIYPGIIAGVATGFNSQGICQSTNYISTINPKIGIPRFFLGRKILESNTLSEAISIAISEPRAHPWHHNLFSFKTGIYASVETLPDGKINVQYPDYGAYIHTNHTIGLNTENYKDEDLEYRNTSSLPRMLALQGLLSNEELGSNGFDKIMRFMGSHKNRPYSPCHHPVDEIRGQTLATVFFNIKNHSMRVYKGNPCQSFPNGAFEDYKF